MNSGRQDFSASVLTSVIQSVRQSVLNAVSQTLIEIRATPELFILTGFVPDAGFGNGWFASSDWPANKRERDVIFDPFLSPRNIICFGTRQAVFSVTRNRFRNRKQLARKGGGNSSEVVVFYRAPRVPDANSGSSKCLHPPARNSRIRNPEMSWNGYKNGDDFAKSSPSNRCYSIRFSSLKST